MSRKDVKYLPEWAVSRIAEYNDLASRIENERRRNTARIEHELMIRRQAGL
jgi:hypothetical protein